MNNTPGDHHHHHGTTNSYVVIRAPDAVSCNLSMLCSIWYTPELRGDHTSTQPHMACIVWYCTALHCTHTPPLLALSIKQFQNLPADYAGCLVMHASHQKSAVSFSVSAPGSPACNFNSEQVQLQHARPAGTHGVTSGIPAVGTACHEYPTPAAASTPHRHARSSHGDKSIMPRCRYAPCEADLLLQMAL